MPFPVKQVPLKTILNLVKKSTFNFQAVKSLNKGFFVNYPKSGKINPVRISIQPVKIIRTLVKKIQSGKNYPKFGKENPLAVKPIKTRFPVDYPKFGKNYPKFGKENPLAVKPIKTRFPVDYPKFGKNYPNFGKINPFFQKDTKFGKENALQIP